MSSQGRAAAAGLGRYPPRRPLPDRIKIFRMCQAGSFCPAVVIGITRDESPDHDHRRLPQAQVHHRRLPLRRPSVPGRLRADARLSRVRKQTLHSLIRCLLLPMLNTRPLQSTTCQCNQCRRNTSSLLFVSHDIETSPPAAFKLTSADGATPPPADALKEYRASPSAARVFCGRCGSLLYWKADTSAHYGIAVGTIDPLFLWGEGAPDSPEAREHGVPAGGFARALVSPGRHFWCGNEIPGVTDPGSMAIMASGKRVEDNGE